jgi:hypothetical protein
MRALVLITAIVLVPAAVRAQGDFHFQTPRRSRGSRGTVKDATGAPLANWEAEKFNEDAHWRDLILFYEYFHGDNGAGLGAGHQTGWTGVVARLMHLSPTTTGQQVLDLDKLATMVDIESVEVA